MTAILLSAVLLAQGENLVGKPAPEFIGKEWMNTDKPLKMSDRKGKVTLVYFWTFACYNCKNNLPAIKNLTEAFKKEGVETISIHTPELKEERDVANVKKAIEKNGIKYPVLIDGDFSNWKAWQTNVWPCLYVVDKHNRVRGGWLGELNYNNQGGEEKMMQLIRKLLKED
jgi:alkyl hydroperoxide reductase subunit AhpC